MAKCKCGGTLKSTYYPIAPSVMSGYKCILFCTKSKVEVVGGGVLCTKRDAYALAKEKLEKQENREEFKGEK